MKSLQESLLDSEEEIIQSVDNSKIDCDTFESMVDEFLKRHGVKVHENVAKFDDWPMEQRLGNALKKYVYKGVEYIYYIECIDRHPMMLWMEYSGSQLSMYVFYQTGKTRVGGGRATPIGSHVYNILTHVDTDANDWSYRDGQYDISISDVHEVLNIYEEIIKNRESIAKVEGKGGRFVPGKWKAMIELIRKNQHIER